MKKKNKIIGKNLLCFGILLITTTALSPLNISAEENIEENAIEWKMNDSYILSEEKHRAKVEEASEQAQKTFSSNVVHSDLTLLQALMKDKGYSYDIASKGIEKADLDFNKNAQKRIDYYLAKAEKESKELSDWDLRYELELEGYINSGTWKKKDYYDLVQDLVDEGIIQKEWDIERDYPNLSEAKKEELVDLGSRVGEGLTSRKRLLQILSEKHDFTEEEIEYVKYNLHWDPYIIAMNRVNQSIEREKEIHSKYSIIQKLLNEGHAYEIILGGIENQYSGSNKWQHENALRAVKKYQGQSSYSKEELLKKLEVDGFAREYYLPAVDGHDSSDQVAGWIKTGDEWHYINDAGEMETAWTKVKSKWYYLNSSGVMQTGWNKIKGKWYYMNASGAMQTGWTKVKGSWYYMASGGSMQTGWVKLGSHWYYLQNSGAMQTGNARIAGKNYHFDSSGKMR